MSDTRIKAGQFFGVVGHGTDGYFLMTNADGSMTWEAAGSPSPTIASVSYPGDDLAADPAGGQTVTITGTNFATGATVTVGGTAASIVSFVSATELTFTTPTKTAGDYDLVVTNTDGGTATSVNGISYNGIPAWTTATGSLGTFASDTTISTITLQASEPDAGTITFSITNGSLPTGLSLTGADIDGTTSIVNADTLYNFTVVATDDENQSSTPRAFSITVEKYIVVSFENFTINTYTGNGSTQSIEGKIGTAASFDGTSYIQMPTFVDNTSNNTDFSVSVWINPSDVSGFKSLIGHPNITNRSPLALSLYFGGNGSTAYFSIERGFGGTVYYAGSYNSAIGATINANQWYHLVFTYEASTKNIEVFLNGSSIGTDTLDTTTSKTIVSDMYFGSYYAANTYDYKGLADQVRIFDKAISSSEVTTLYGEPNNLSTASTTDIFADGSGVALYDFKEEAKSIGAKKHYLHVSDAGGQNTSVRINSVDSEFTYARPTGYAEWGGSFDSSNTATDFVGSSTGFVFSESNKKWDKPTSNYFHSVWSTNGYSSGKYYVELEFLNADLIFGLSTSETADTVHSGASFYDNAISYFSYTAQKRIYSSTSVSGGAVLATNDVIGFAVDFDNQTLKYYINNTLVETETLANYNGTSTNVSFVGTSFQPDAIWIKSRDNSRNHRIHDSLRVGEIYPNLTNAESSFVGISSYDSNGFTIGTSDVSYNANGEDYVAWCWKAGGAASTYNIDGTGYATLGAAGLSITGNGGNSPTFTGCSINTQSGFGIYEIDPNFTASNHRADFTHGLNSTPQLIFAKVVDGTGGNWWAFTNAIDGSWDRGKLHTTDAFIDDTLTGADNATSTLIRIEDAFISTASRVLFYAFASVDGYQKVGSYSGGSTNTIYTTDDGTSTGDGGFKPRFLLVKRTNRDGDDWHLFDSTREGDDSTDKFLKPNTSDTESNGGADRTVNFTSDGFNWTNANSNAVNASGGEYIYLAIA